MNGGASLSEIVPKEFDSKPGQRRDMRLARTTGCPLSLHATHGN